MKKTILLFFLVSLIFVQSNAKNSTYTLVVEGYDWGPGASKVILPMEDSVSTATASSFFVHAIRRTSFADLTPERAEGDRKVLYAYVSDPDGHPLLSGNHITLVLLVGPQLPLSAPMEYLRSKTTGWGNSQWLDYQLVVTAPEMELEWNTESRRIRPIVDQFQLDGVYEYEPGKEMNYAYYKPAANKESKPLIIWLHGGGEGGHDPSVPLMANKAANYASPEIQQIFDGAYVLVPQCPGAWMHNKQGEMTPGRDNDVYNIGLMALINNFLASFPNIDQKRIYVGGCSNGGYMSLKLILMYPETFAAAYISSLAYESEYITDAQIRSISHVPIWFLQTADDHTTLPEKTVIPVYHRLMAAGAKNVHFSFYDYVVDLTGLFGGADYHHSGHSSWIYCHANHCFFDYDGSAVKVDGRPVKIMEWLAAQHK